MSNDTIFAVSSGHPPTGVCVIRISGPQAKEALLRMTGKALPEPRRLVWRKMYHPDNTEDLIDEVLAVWFPGPASFTGEDSVELHVHGGRAVVAATLNALSGLSGYSLAEPGAFSRRAFDNGKLDLSEAEGLADLITAETEIQRKQALRQLDGRLGSLCSAWQERLKSALAHMEASIDFSDEDLPDTLDQESREAISSVRDEIIHRLDDNNKGEIIRGGVHIAIVGPPNAGKSSLLNYLAAREAAIVSEQAGTTRDIIDVHMDLGGFPVIVSDTAGLRDSEDGIEQEGVRRAKDRAEASDVRLLVFDGSTWPEADPQTRRLLRDGAIGVLNKTDLVDGGAGLTEYAVNGVELIGISVKTGAGLESLLSEMTATIASRFSGGDAAIVTRARHREALIECCDGLSRCMEASGAELWAEDLRLAMRALGRITGQVGVEDILDVIFSEFCIGK